MRSLLLATLAGLVMTGAAFAQQDQGPVTWSSPLGKITYVTEDGTYGVLEYETPFGDGIGRFNIDGLAGEFGGPGPLKGYWTESDVSHDDEDDDTLICPFTINDSDGRVTRNWGRLEIVFTDDYFPADFVLLRGRCFAELDEVIGGKLAR